MKFSQFLSISNVFENKIFKVTCTANCFTNCVKMSGLLVTLITPPWCCSLVVVKMLSVSVWKGSSFITVCVELRCGFTRKSSQFKRSCLIDFHLSVFSWTSSKLSGELMALGEESSFWIIFFDLCKLWRT